MPYSDDALRFIMTEFYVKPKRKPRAVHPRDIVEELVDIAKFRGVAPTLSNELITLACQAYFLRG